MDQSNQTRFKSNCLFNSNGPPFSIKMDPPFSFKIDPGFQSIKSVLFWLKSDFSFESKIDQKVNLSEENVRGNKIDKNAIIFYTVLRTATRDHCEGQKMDFFFQKPFFWPPTRVAGLKKSSWSTNGKGADPSTKKIGNRKNDHFEY